VILAIGDVPHPVPYSRDSPIGLERFDARDLRAKVALKGNALAVVATSGFGTSATFSDVSYSTLIGCEADSGVRADEGCTQCESRWMSFSRRLVRRRVRQEVAELCWQVCI